MKVNFRAVTVSTGIEGTCQVFDLSKTVGNVIYARTGDIGMLDFAKKIYYKGEVACTDEQVEQICKIISACDLIAVVKVAILDMLNPKEDKKDGND